MVMSVEEAAMSVKEAMAMFADAEEDRWGKLITRMMEVASEALESVSPLLNVMMEELAEELAVLEVFPSVFPSEK